MFSKIKQDLRVNEGVISPIVIITYRFGNWVHYTFRFPIIKSLLWFMYRVLYFFVCVISKSEIPATAKLGTGIKLEHGGNGIIIYTDVSVGENSTIFQQVTIGIEPHKKKTGPKIGKNAFIGAGAKIIGDINIGDNVKIGANAVVIRDVPSNVTAVGIPAKYIKH